MKPNNHNAQAGPEPASSFLHVRCMPRSKSGWCRAAERERIKLAAWVVRTLDAAARAAGVPE